MYQNVITTDRQAWRTYYVMAEYEDLEIAKTNLERDCDSWRVKYPKWWKWNYPFSYATIKKPEHEEFV